jgi:hypothetical protein
MSLEPQEVEVSISRQTRRLSIMRGEFLQVELSSGIRAVK